MELLLVCYTRLTADLTVSRTAWDNHTQASVVWTNWSMEMFWSRSVGDIIVKCEWISHRRALTYVGRLYVISQDTCFVFKSVCEKILP